MDEGEIPGDDCGEFALINTKSQIIINQPLINNLHSNYQIMKRKDGDINWNNFATPVLRPKRNYEVD
jgi:hypothetical protein